jgi:hypothetical protein
VFLKFGHAIWNVKNPSQQIDFELHLVINMQSNFDKNLIRLFSQLNIFVTKLEGNW